jgi:predicted amidophosphoribosyltransferase
VPLTPLKYLLRGFNLPSLVARELARRAGWPCRLSLLERSSGREPQARLHRPERQGNVRAAFRAPRPVPPDVLLLDDVFTTGATASACALALKRGGARHIVVVTLARAVHAP